MEKITEKLELIKCNIKRVIAIVKEKNAKIGLEYVYDKIVSLQGYLEKAFEDSTPK